MTFEFIIACNTTPETNIRQTLTELLTGVLADKQNDFNEGILDDMIRIRHRRLVARDQDEGELTANTTLIGFAVELPDETVDADDVIRQFIRSLPNTPPISHTVKFEDPLLETYLAEYAREIFALEMKLRRVLSLVYLNAYQFDDPYNLLRDEKEENQPTRHLQSSHMTSAAENQFFHLTLSQYTNLNQRQEMDLSLLLNSIQNSDNYADLHAEISRRPIENEEDASLIASLKGITGPIVQMRNCVAHNRFPERSIRNNYPSARDQLDDQLNEYLASWGVEV